MARATGAGKRAELPIREVNFADAIAGDVGDEQLSSAADDRDPVGLDEPGRVPGAAVAERSWYHRRRSW